MCTVAFRLDPDAGVLRLLSVRDEFLDRPTRPIGRWWPDLAPNVLGAQDVVAGGTNLAFDGAKAQVWVVVNGPTETSICAASSRGWLPLNGVRGQLPDPEQLTQMPGFHLLQGQTHSMSIWSWDGRLLTAHQVDPGNHVLTFAGLDAPHHQRGRATADALEAATLDSDPESWADILAQAWVRPYDLESRPYGSVSATAVRLGSRDALCWTLSGDRSWQPVTKRGE